MTEWWINVFCYINNLASMFWPLFPKLSVTEIKFISKSFLILSQTLQKCIFVFRDLIDSSQVWHFSHVMNPHPVKLFFLVNHLKEHDQQSITAQVKKKSANNEGEQLLFEHGYMNAFSFALKYWIRKCSLRSYFAQGNVKRCGLLCRLNIFCGFAKLCLVEWMNYVIVPTYQVRCTSSYSASRRWHGNEHLGIDEGGGHTDGDDGNSTLSRGPWNR